VQELAAVHGVGCNPSNALIDAPKSFSASPEGLRATGISAAGPAIELAATMDWKDGIATRLTGGAAALLRNAGVHVALSVAFLVIRTELSETGDDL